jgi:hypothetical protein
VIVSDAVDVALSIEIATSVGAICGSIQRSYHCPVDFLMRRRRLRRAVGCTAWLKVLAYFVIGLPWQNLFA